MHFDLRDGLSVCMVARSAVFLDIRSGRYFAIGEDALPAFARWWANEDLSTDDLAALRRLCETGLLIAGAAEGSRPRPAVHGLPPPSTHLERTGSRPRPAAVLSALAHRLLWSWRAKHWRFERLIAKISSPVAALDQALSPEAAEKLRSTVRAFDIVGVAIGSHDRCLGHSLALTAACRRQGLAASLVIAVQAAPFAAHSWVQHGGTVLNEKPDIAQLFTPILVA